MKASLLFRRYDSEGVPTGEAGVNAAAVPATRFVTFAEQAAGQAGTGVAYANPSATAAARVTFTARDEAGRALASVDQTLMPGGHGAQNMAGLFGLSSFSGSLEITSRAPIVSLSLNAEAAPIFSSLPAGEPDAAAQGATTYYFPHLAVGASWQTTITYINYSPQEVSCRTEFLSDQGTPLMVSFPGLGPVVSRTDVLPPGGSVHEETDVGLSAALAAGWARADCSGPVKASLLFRQYDSAGAPTGEAGVNAAAVATTERAEAPGHPLRHLCRTGGRPGWDRRRLCQPFRHGNGRGHLLSSFSGSLEITSRAPIVSLSLNAEAAPVFSSLPPGELDAADIPREMLAPADEAAFNDLFVGKRVRSDIPNYYIDFISPGRFRETEGSAIFSGSYTYRNTGPNTGTVTLNYDNGDRCTFRLTFTSATSGRGTFSCNDGTSGSTGWRLVEIPATGAPDLVVRAPSVSDSSPDAGSSFTLRATVRNQGNGPSTSTTLRYYRSPNANISTSDTEVGTDAVGSLSASGSSAESISLTAPSSAGTYYYGACVEPVSGESDTRNNCSVGVRVTVGGGGGGTAPGLASDFDLASANGSPGGITFANGRFYVVDWEDAKAYVYEASGRRVPAADFDLAPGNIFAIGITFANGRFYVVDSVKGKVYAYDASGRGGPGDGDGDTSQTCANGSIIKPGGSCDLKDAKGMKIGTFQVTDEGRGCLRIGGATLCAGTGHNLNNTRISQYRITFVASKQTNGNWRISRLSITL